MRIVFPGTPALTTRGFTAPDFVRVAAFFDRAVKLAIELSTTCGTGHKLADFKAKLAAQPPAGLKALQDEVRYLIYSIVKCVGASALPSCPR